jgi:hypothetical protein
MRRSDGEKNVPSHRRQHSGGTSPAGDAILDLDLRIRRPPLESPAHYARGAAFEARFSTDHDIFRYLYGRVQV